MVEEVVARMLEVRFILVGGEEDKLGGKIGCGLLKIVTCRLKTVAELLQGHSSDKLA